MYLEFIKMLVALAVVLGLLFLVMRLLKNRILPRQGLVTLLHYHPFGTKKGIAVVKILEEYYALGVADAGITVITRLSAEQVEGTIKNAEAEEGASGGIGLRNLFNDNRWRLPFKKDSND